jgi:hypothetical protein
MSYHEILDQARRLPLQERLRLVEELVRDMRRSERPASRRDRKVRPMSQLRGALKSDGPLPTDDDLRNSYADHVLGKHL